MEYAEAEEEAGPSDSTSSLALPCRFPGGESLPLRVIEDDEYLAPPIAEEKRCSECPVQGDVMVEDQVEEEASGKENEEPIPVPEPRVLRDLAVRGSVRTFRLSPPSNPYTLRHALFPERPAPQRQVAYHRRSMHS